MQIGQTTVYNGFLVVVIGEPQPIPGGVVCRVRVLSAADGSPHGLTFDTEFNAAF